MGKDKVKKDDADAVKSVKSSKSIKSIKSKPEDAAAEGGGETEGEVSDEETEATATATPATPGEGKKSGKAKSKWTKEQKKQLEEAIKKYPESTPDRWEAIAKEVTGKSKVACQKLYEKFLKRKNAASGKLAAQGGHWTPEQRTALAAGLKKYPKGSKGRWAKIAADVGRTKEECITKYTAIIEYKARHKDGATGEANEDAATATQIEETGDDGKDAEALVQASKDAGTKGETGDWNVEMDKVLLQGLKKFPRGTADRWEKISGLITGKTKDECMIRYVLLGELAKKRKETQQGEAEPGTNGPEASKKTGGAWTRDQRSALIHAAKEYPKGSPNRWDLVAKHVGRSKEECMYKYTQLVEFIARKKAQGIEATGMEEETETEKGNTEADSSGAQVDVVSSQAVKEEKQEAEASATGSKTELKKSKSKA